MPEIVVPVELTHGYSALVSIEDYDRVRPLRWRVRFVDGNVYAVSCDRHGPRRSKAVPMHRFILAVTDPKVKVDHQDGYGLHNWRSNLRMCTNAQNIRNQQPHVDKQTSEYKGVYRLPNGLYRSQIMFERKKFNRRRTEARVCGWNVGSIL